MRSKIIIFIVLFALMGWGIYEKRQEKKYFATLTKKIEVDLPQKTWIKYQEQLRDSEKKIPHLTRKDKLVDTLLEKAEALENLGRLEESYKTYNYIISFEPDDPAIYAKLSDVQAEMNDLKGAEKSIRKAIKLDPSSARWKKYLALKKDRFQASKEEMDKLYKTAIKETPGNFALIVDYAKYLEKEGDIQGAIQYWQIAKDRSSDDKEEYQAEIDRLNKK